MSYSSQPGWHPDPEGVSNQLRWWDGQQWTSATRPSQFGSPPAPTVSGSGRRKWLIAVAVTVVALIVYISFAAVTGFEPGEDDELAATSSSTIPVNEAPLAPTSPAAVVSAAREQCDAGVKQQWVDRGDAYGTPQSLGWTITANDLVSKTPGASWRLRGQYNVKIETARGRVMGWEQTFYCDIEYYAGTDSYTANVLPT